MALGAADPALCPVPGAREGEHTGNHQSVTSGGGSARGRQDRRHSLDPKDPFLGTEGAELGAGWRACAHGLGPGGWGGGRAEPRDQHSPGFLQGEAAEWSWAGLGWAVGRGRADSRTQQGGKCLREKAVGCVHTCVDIRAVFLTASPLTPQGAGRQAHPDSHRAQEQPCWKLSSLLSCAHASSQSRSSRGRYRVGVHPVSISPVPTPCSQLSNPPPTPSPGFLWAESCARPCHVSAPPPD